MNSDIQYDFTDVSYVFNDNVGGRDFSSEFWKAVDEIREAIAFNIENVRQSNMTSTPRISERGEGVMQDQNVNFSSKEMSKIDENNNFDSSGSNTSNSSLSSLFESITSEDSATTDESSLTVVSDLSVESWLQAIDCFDSSASDSFVNDLSSNTSLFTNGSEEIPLLDESSLDLTDAESMDLLQKPSLTEVEVNFNDCVKFCEVVKNDLDITELCVGKELKLKSSSHSDTSQTGVTSITATHEQCDSSVKVGDPFSMLANENERDPLKLKVGGIKVDLGRYAVFDLVDKVMGMSDTEATELRFRTLSYYFSKQTELGKRQTLVKEKLREIRRNRPFYARLLPCFRSDDAYAEASQELKYVRAMLAEVKKQVSLWKTIFRFRSDGVSAGGLLTICKLHFGERLRRIFRR